MNALTKPTNLRLVAAVVSLILVSALIVRTTQAAFSDTETNAGNSFASGQVDLSTVVTLPMFAPGGMGYTVDTAAMNGGQNETNCIDVTYTGDLDTASDVTLAAASSAAGSGLDDYLDVDVTVWDGTGCTGTQLGTVFNQTLASVLAAGATPTGWQPTAAGGTVYFKFDVQLQDDNAAQNLTSDTVTFTWSAQS